MVLLSMRLAFRDRLLAIFHESRGAVVMNRLLCWVSRAFRRKFARSSPKLIVFLRRLFSRVGRFFCLTVTNDAGGARERVLPSARVGSERERTNCARPYFVACRGDARHNDVVSARDKKASRSAGLAKRRSRSRLFATGSGGNRHLFVGAHLESEFA